MRWSHIIGVDDAPFARDHRGDVLIVGVAVSGDRVDGVLSSRVRRDGTNATPKIARMIKSSQFFAHLHGVLLQGIAVAGFNVIDLHRLSAELDKPVLVVARKQPDLEKIRRALLTKVKGGHAKWRLIEKAGAMEPIGDVLVQRSGLDRAEASALLEAFQKTGNIPEPLRLAHLIAGGVTTGRSRGRA